MNISYLEGMPLDGNYRLLNSSGYCCISDAQICSTTGQLLMTREEITKIVKGIGSCFACFGTGRPVALCHGEITTIKVYRCVSDVKCPLCNGTGDYTEETSLPQREYYGRILPSGNAAEFPLIEAQLRQRGIPFKFAPLTGGGGVFSVRAEDLERLPMCPIKKDRYLPCDETGGWNIYPLDQRATEGDI